MSGRARWWVLAAVLFVGGFALAAGAGGAMGLPMWARACAGVVCGVLVARSGVGPRRGRS